MKERANRKIEALRLYEPLPVLSAFHRSNARCRLVRGSNRGGKTLPAAVEIARAVTGNDPKYPKEGGRAFCVGKDLDHIGQVMWRKLGRAGAFKIIRDSKTGMWRAYRPWLTKDSSREGEIKEAPPLIPLRLIKKISWEKKGESIPSLVQLTNGWELSFYSSLGKPPQGADVDIVWLDEEVVDEDWVPEMQARVIDRRGRIIWSFTPQAGTDQAFELHERAEKQRENGVAQPDVEEFEVFLENNPHIRKEEKTKLAESYSEEEYRVRILGEFAQIGAKVYPEFSTLVHVVERDRDGEAYENYSRLWTRYAVVDPGHQVCAVLFAAVPPPEFGNYIYCEDELYLHRCNADTFGQEMAAKCGGRRFHAFVIDAHMAIHTEVGIGKTIAQQYEESLARRKIRSDATGSGFALAKSMTKEDLRAGIVAVRDLLRIRDDGTARLRVLAGSCPNMIWEIKRYSHKRGQHGFLDLPDQKRHNHLMDGLRYLAMYNPRYIPHAPSPAKKSWIQAAMEKYNKKTTNDGVVLRFGPGRDNANL